MDSEVLELLSGRGRLQARAFLSDLDRLIDSSEGPRVTAESAARQIADESNEYGSDFVEAVAARDMLQALRLLGKLLSGATFSAFRPWGAKEEAPGGEEGPARRGRVLPAPRSPRRRRAADARAPRRARGAGRRAASRGLPNVRGSHPARPEDAASRSPGAAPRRPSLHPAQGVPRVAELDRGRARRRARRDRGDRPRRQDGRRLGSELLEAWLLSRLRPAARSAAG